MPNLLEATQNVHPAVGQAYPRLGHVLDGELGPPVLACYPANCAREMVAF